MADENTPNEAPQNQEPAPAPVPTPNLNSEQAPTGDPKDIEENKILAVIGYLGILFLVPLLAKKESPYAQFHGRQGMVLFIVEVVGYLIAVIPFVGWFLSLILGIFTFVLAIMGIINAAGGKMKELPVIGEYAKKINL